jgi:nucleotide-binding universal stress UspA family protein
MQPGSAILLPVDFSERAAPAARYAQHLAAQFDSNLILLHVLAPFQYELGAGDLTGYMVTDLFEHRARQAAQELDAFLADELPGPCVERLVLEGDPARAIVETAHERAALVLMPTHGYGPFRRFILGSVTAKVLHDADCPVWTGVHLEEAPAAPLPPRRILCAVDLGPQSAKTLCWASSLARRFDAGLTLLHVALGPPGAARDELDRLRSDAHANAAVRIETGDPPSAICVVAAAADLLVIGRGSAAGVFGRLRANAYSIIRQSPCPVVSV